MPYLIRSENNQKRIQADNEDLEILENWQKDLKKAKALRNYL